MGGFTVYKNGEGHTTIGVVLNYRHLIILLVTDKNVEAADNYPKHNIAL